MNFKSKIICLLLVFVLFLSVGAVSADEMTAQSIIEESKEYSSVSTEIATDEILSASNDAENLASPDDGTFKALQSKINSTSSGDEIKLENNYTYGDDFDQSGIIISKPLTIDGNGYTIDAMGEGRIFNITSSNVTLKNINFKNANYDDDFSQGGAIFWNGNFGILENCTFENCSAGEGGAIYYGENINGTILGCNFTDCSADYSGGAIYSMSNYGCSVVECNFMNCSAYSGGAIMWMANSESFVVDSNFTDCISYEYGGAIYWTENAASYITDCNFMNCAINSDSEEGDYGGGAICWFGNMQGNDDVPIVVSTFMSCVANSTFVNCSATGRYANGGAIKWGSQNDAIDNCNFVDCSATLSGGAISLYYSDNGIIHNCNFINCSTTFDADEDIYASGGAIYLYECNNFTVDHCVFENCSSAGFGGAIDSYSDTSNNTVNYCIFTGNSAINGSAIYYSNQHGTFTIKNSILLNNRANSDQLNLTEKNNNITIVFTGNDNLLNAIYTEDNIDFDNVSYWGVNGIMNTDSRPLSKSNREEGQYIFITINNNGLIKQYMDVTDEKGEISFNVNVAGDYRISAYHPEDSYYTESNNATLRFSSGNSSDLNLTVSDVTATAAVTSGAVGNVTFTINNESGIVKEQTVNLDNGIANLDLSDLNAGKYNITAVYNGDSYYWPSVNKTSFEIYKIDNYDITVDAKAGTVEEITNITVTVPSKITGKVTVNINGTVYSTTKINNTTYVAHVSGLAAGNYVVNASVVDDPKYADKTSDVEQFDVTKVSAYNIGVAVDPNPAEVGSVVNVTVTLPGDVTGSVTVNINGTDYPTVKINDTAYVADVSTLTAGNYVVNASVVNDPKYVDKTSDDVTLLVVGDENYIIDAPDLTKYYSGPERFIVNVTYVRGAPVVGKEVKITINGVTYNRTTNENGTASLSINLNSATYDVTTVVDNITVESVVTVLPTIEAEDIESKSKNIVFTATFLDGEGNYLTNGTNVSFNIDGVIYNSHVSDNKGGVSVDLVLNNGKYIITSLNSVTGESISNNITVDLKDVDMILSGDEIIVGENATVGVKLNVDATGNVYAEIGGKNYTSPVNEGNALIIIPGLAAGNYTFQVIYSGDYNYNNASGEVSVKVTKVDPNIVIEDSVITVGEDATVTITLPGDAGGNIRIGNEIVPVENGTAKTILTGLKAGINTIPIIYSGDDKYNSIETSVDVVVNEKPDPVKKNLSIEASADVIIGSEDVVIIVTGLENATGNVSVVVHGHVHSAPIVNGTAQITISGIIGNATAYISYSGDDVYNSAVTIINISVDKNDTIIIYAPNLTKYYKGPQKFVVTVTDAKGQAAPNKTVEITINGVTYKRTTDENGTVSLNINLNNGQYPVVVSADDVTVNSSVTVLSTIYSSDVVKMFRNDTQYNAIFTDSNGNPLANIDVSFNIHGIIYNRTTDKNGAVKLNINLDAGDYILTALNPVTGEMKSNTVKVISLIVSDDLTKYYRNASQFVVRIRSADGGYVGAGEKVTFNINGVFYTRMTNATGHAMLNINLHQGNFTITTYHKDCSQGNNIEVLPILSADDLVMKYMDGSQFKVQLVDGQGKAYAGQTVTFNINGVFYRSVTDNTGQAKLNINLMPGAYIITSSYNGFNISNTIKISA